MRRSNIEIYGEDYFKKTWTGWIDAMQRLYEKQNGNLCKQVLSKIKCPTLIIHGGKDPLVLPEHPQYLKQNIVSSKFVSLFEFEKIKIDLRNLFTTHNFSCITACIFSKKADIIFIWNTLKSLISWWRISC